MKYGVCEHSVSYSFICFGVTPYISLKCNTLALGSNCRLLMSNT